MINHQQTDREALRAYHLDRIFAKFNLVISAENAELLAALLGTGEDNQGNAD